MMYLCREEKLPGILIETQPLNDKEIAVVIGVGLNYDMSVLRYDQSLDLPELTDICYELESGQKAEGAAAFTGGCAFVAASR